MPYDSDGEQMVFSVFEAFKSSRCSEREISEGYRRQRPSHQSADMDYCWCGGFVVGLEMDRIMDL